MYKRDSFIPDAGSATRDQGPIAIVQAITSGPLSEIWDLMSLISLCLPGPQSHGQKIPLLKEYASNCIRYRPPRCVLARQLSDEVGPGVEQ